MVLGDRDDVREVRCMKFIKKKRERLKGIFKSQQELNEQFRKNMNQDLG